MYNEINQKSLKFKCAHFFLVLNFLRKKIEEMNVKLILLEKCAILYYY